jgi:hypothetical protein
VVGKAKYKYRNYHNLIIPNPLKGNYPIMKP